MGELYERVYAWDNLRLAHRKAARGKRGKAAAAAFEYRLADNLLQLREELEAQSYHPGAYHSFYIHEPKRRLISAAPFRDRVVHHALCRVIEPLWEPRFINIWNPVFSADGGAIAAEIRTDMDTWHKYHVALLFPTLAPALYAAGVDNYRLARTRQQLVPGAPGVTHVAARAACQARIVGAVEGEGCAHAERREDAFLQPRVQVHAGGVFDQRGQVLRGDPGAMSPDARRGMALFYGRANCSSCHEGPFQTDHRYHAIAMPQIGPGKADGRDPSYWNETGINAVLEDFGRGRVTVRPADNYKFRTPSLRNVATTGPWSHAGAYDSLEAVVRHHLDPVAPLHAYELDEAGNRLWSPADGIVLCNYAGDQLGPLVNGGRRNLGLWVERG